MMAKAILDLPRFLSNKRSKWFLSGTDAYGDRGEIKSALGHRQNEIKLAMSKLRASLQETLPQRAPTMTHEELENGSPLCDRRPQTLWSGRPSGTSTLRLRRLSYRLERLSNRRFAAAVRTDARNAPEHAQSQDPGGPGIDHKPA